jgi:hypothetical protein
MKTTILPSRTLFYNESQVSKITKLTPVYSSIFGCNDIVSHFVDKHGCKMSNAVAVLKIESYMRSHNLIESDKMLIGRISSSCSDTRVNSMNMILYIR